MSTLEEAQAAALAHREKMERIVCVKEGHIVIDLFELCDAPSEYNIPLQKCTTSTQILGWVQHLSEKTWLTNDVLRRFVTLATATAGIDLHES